MDSLVQVLLRCGALALAFLAGWGFGSCIPGWKTDRWNEVNPYPEGDALDVADPMGMFQGCGSLFGASAAELKASCSGFALVNLILLTGGFVLAMGGWPPVWMNPVTDHPVEFTVVTVFQRWIWYTLGTCLLGLTASGAYSCYKRWFRR